jgi:hypothetical protein
MRKLLALSAIVCFAGASFAHEPADTEYLVYQFADGNTPDADGDLSDWDLVPDSYTIGNDKIYGTIDQGAGTGVGLSDASDLNMTHRVGWNENANRLYFATTIFDNVHNTDRAGGCFCVDDALEIEVNMDHSAHADENVDVANRIAYKYAVPPVDGAYAFSRPIAGVTEWLYPGSEWLDFGWSFTGEEFGESTYYYEMSITPIESFPLDEATALEGVEVWDLEEGDLFHLALNVGDIDVEDTYHGFWSTSPTSWTTDFVLDELIDTQTAVEAGSWARIKAQYK